MPTPARITTPPKNLAEYALEISGALNQLYGESAATHYERVAISGVIMTISTPGIVAWGLESPGGDVAGMVFARVAPERTVIFFFHVLESFRGVGHEAELLDFVLQDLSQVATEIYTEYIPFFELDVSALYRRHGFRQIMRQIMRRAASVPVFEPCPGPDIQNIGPGTCEGPAKVLAEAYAQHRERHLFREVHTEALAMEYLERAQSGYYGTFCEGNALGVWDAGRCVGLALGCEVLSGVGFILHLAVHPGRQGRGIGGALLEQLCQNFARQGLRYAALGVTCDNPATTLYERAGFSTILHLPVYYRAAGSPA